MKLDIHKGNEIFLLNLSGDFLADNCHELRHTLKDLLRDRPKRIYVDLNGLKVIDSVALGALLGLKISSGKFDADLIIVNRSVNIDRILQEIRFDKVFRILRAIPEKEAAELHPFTPQG